MERSLQNDKGGENGIQRDKSTAFTQLSPAGNGHPQVALWRPARRIPKRFAGLQRTHDGLVVRVLGHA
jgi:hypothetical protein